MTKFDYRWTLGGRELRGVKVCADSAVLKTHIETLGGRLLEILQEEGVPDAAPEISGNVDVSEPLPPAPAPGLFSRFFGKKK